MVALNFLLVVNTENRHLPKKLQVSVQELHNSMSSTSRKDGINQPRDEENNIIISDSMLRNIIPPQLKICLYGTR